MAKHWLVLVIAVFAGCGTPPPPLAPPEPPVVTVERPVERLLDSYLEFTGYLKAAKELEVRAQVTGYLKAIKFSDGKIVKPGDVLYEIDPEPYDAAKQSAQANLATAESSLKKAEFDAKTAEEKQALAKKDFARQEELKTGGGAAQAEYDKAKSELSTTTSALTASLAARDSAAATRDAAAAALRKAQFDRDNCTIKLEAKELTAVENTIDKTPPELIRGRVSRTYITEGNLVQAGQTLLCKVVSMNPIYAYWDVDEATSLMYRRKIYDEKSLPDPRERNLKCWLATKDEQGFPHAGSVNYIAPEIIRGSGNREVRGVFDNADFRLAPGDSVRVKVEAGPPAKHITVPEIAVGSRQQQKFVYVVVTGEGGKTIAEFRPVVVGPMREVDGVRLVMIESGVTPADRIVVNGLLRVRPGAAVNAQEQSKPVAPK